MMPDKIPDSAEYAISGVYVCPHCKDGDAPAEQTDGEPYWVCTYCQNFYEFKGDE